MSTCSLPSVNGCKCVLWSELGLLFCSSWASSCSWCTKPKHLVSSWMFLLKCLAEILERSEGSSNLLSSSMTGSDFSCEVFKIISVSTPSHICKSEKAWCPSVCVWNGVKQTVDGNGLLETVIFLQEKLTSFILIICRILSPKQKNQHRCTIWQATNVKQPAFFSLV